MIRALSAASDVLSRYDTLEVAAEIFDLHPFDDQLGLWERVEIDGENLSFDRTLNQQILFAEAASALPDSVGLADKRVRRFLDVLDANMAIRSTGLIRHYIRPPVPRMLFAVMRTPRYKDLLWNEGVRHYHTVSDQRKQKERGYQTVNLSALSELKVAFPDHPFWDTSKVESAVTYLHENQREIMSGIRVKHGTPIQGIGIAKSLAGFLDRDIESYSDHIQSELSINPQTGEFLFEADTIDANMRAALVVTLTELPNITVVHSQ